MEVGDYVRFIDGTICKCISIKKYKTKNDIYNFDKILDRYEDRAENDNFIRETELFLIMKSSPNIIDLIEVGDYVNGRLVKNINTEKTFVIVETPSIIQDTIYNEDIKSIVTKEMFERVEYKV